MTGRQWREYGAMTQPIKNPTSHYDLSGLREN
jgi:hypothetical protein